MTILLAFLALIPRILLGYGTTELIWKTTTKNILVKIFLSGPVGFGISSLLAFLWIWIGFPLLNYIILEGVIVICLTIYSLPKYWRAISLQPSISFFTNKFSKLWISLLLISFFMFGVELLLTALRYPHGRMDAWTQWNVVARFIYLGGSNWQITFLRQLDHPDYPLFLAINNAISWSIMQKNSIWGPIAFHISICFFMVGIFFSLINSFKGLKQASLATIILIAQPIVISMGINQYAETFLAYLFLAVGGLTTLYFSTREKGLAFMIGLLTGFACWTKNEGTVLVISNTLIWIIIALKGDRGYKNYLLGLAIPLLIVALFKIYLAPTSDLLSTQQQIIERILNLERYGIILREAGKMLWGLGYGISLIGIMMIYSFIMGQTKNKIPSMWSIATIIFLQLSAYLFIYLITPYPLPWHLKTSIDRVLYHIIPLALFWAFIYIKSPEELHQST